MKKLIIAGLLALLAPTTFADTLPIQSRSFIKARSTEIAQYASISVYSPSIVMQPGHKTHNFVERLPGESYGDFVGRVKGVLSFEMLRVSDTIYGWIYIADGNMQSLFYGGNSFRLELDQNGKWKVPESALDIPHKMSPNIWFPEEDISSALINLRDKYGKHIDTVYLEVGNSGFYFPEKYAGQYGDLVIVRRDQFGNLIGTDTYNLRGDPLQGHEVSGMFGGTLQNYLALSDKGLPANSIMTIPITTIMVDSEEHEPQDPPVVGVSTSSNRTLVVNPPSVKDIRTGTVTEATKFFVKIEGDDSVTEVAFPRGQVRYKVLSLPEAGHYSIWFDFEAFAWKPEQLVPWYGYGTTTTAETP